MPQTKPTPSYFEIVSELKNTLWYCVKLAFVVMAITLVIFAGCSQLNLQP